MRIRERLEVDLITPSNENLVNVAEVIECAHCHSSNAKSSTTITSYTRELSNLRLQEISNLIFVFGHEALQIK